MTPPSFANIKRIDFGFYAILGLIIVTALWLLAMPWNRDIQRSTLNRFQFQTRSYWAWAAQQPIPSMYNFHNRFEVRRTQSVTDRDAVWERGTINHFPLRMITFGDNRGYFLKGEDGCVIDAWSSYRGEQLHTHWTATANPAGGFDFVGEVRP